MLIPKIIDCCTPNLGTESLIDADKVVSGKPLTQLDNRYSDPTDHFHCGIWSSTVGKWTIHYTEHEFCHLLAGRVRLTADDGTVRDLSAGDAFVIPAGFRGTWETLENARKYYALYQP
jgi:hypothetical protein